MKEKVLELYEIVNPVNVKEKVLIPKIERLNEDVKQVVIFSEGSGDTLKQLERKIKKEIKSYVGKGFLEFSIASSIGYLVYPAFFSSIFYLPLKNSVEIMISYYLTRMPMADLMYYVSTSGKNIIQFYSYMPPFLYQLWELFASILPMLVFGGIAFYRFYKRWKTSQRLKKFEKILSNRVIFKKDWRIKRLNAIIRKGKSLNEIRWRAEAMGLKTIAEFIQYIEYWLSKGKKKELDITFLKEKYEV